MQEGMPRQRSEILKSTVVAAGLLLGYEHGPAKAAEIPREASWPQGVEELHRRSKEEPIEFGVDFIQYTDGSSDWLPDIHGDESSVSRDADATVRTTTEHAQGRSIARVCGIHTHSQKYAQRFGEAYAKNPPYMPPSGQDVDDPLNLGRYNYIKQMAPLGVTEESAFRAVIEPHEIGRAHV